ncbi:MAG: adenylate kinase [Dehalococcoidia bacterium]|nr:adenylate kinase [Dehalococcoidia bacterium]
MYFVMLGAPGAGKGTQADLLSEELGFPHIASGDLFRQNLEKQTELGLLAKAYMQKGGLVPDEVTIKMILERIAAPDCDSGCLLDGFPRTLGQAEALDEAFAVQGRNVDRAIYIHVPSEVLVKRLGGRWICRKCQATYHIIASPPKVKGKCDRCGGELYQRADDVEETIRERLRVFFEQTSPIIDFYREQGKLVEVDGDKDIQEVTRDVLSALAEEK